VHEELDLVASLAKAGLNDRACGAGALWRDATPRDERGQVGTAHIGELDALRYDLSERPDGC